MLSDIWLPYFYPIQIREKLSMLDALVWHPVALLAF